MTLILIILLSYSVPNQSIPAETNSLIQQGIEQFNNAFNEWEVSLFHKALQLFQRAQTGSPDSGIPLYWQGTTYFYLSIYYLYALEKDNNPKLGEQNVDKAILVLRKAIELDPHDGESYALLSTLTGMKIDLKPLTALWLGPKVMKYKAKAEEIDANNPRNNYLLGMSYYHGPSFMGGKEKGLKYLLRAEKLFEEENALQSEDHVLQPRWGWSTCLVFIARLYLDEGDIKKGKAYYKKALAANPHDLLAREELKTLEKKNSEAEM